MVSQAAGGPAMPSALQFTTLYTAEKHDGEPAFAGAGSARSMMLERSGGGQVEVLQSV